MLNFGSVFRYRELFYVYLIQTDDNIYAAKILDRETTKELIKNYEVKSKNPRNRTNEKPIYCFVILTTDEFKDRAAHYGAPDMPTDIAIEPFSMLNESDLNKLKKEIIEDANTPLVLRKTLKELFEDGGR